MENIMNLKIAPDWDNIEKVRIRTEDFLEEKNLGRDIKDSIIMNISELMENAVKYGKFDDKIKEITASVTVTDNDIIVEVKSPVKDEDDFHFKRLDRIIQWIRGFQNPFEAYIEKLKEIAIQPVTESESGIGIIRIAYEGQSILDFYINDNGVISVSAVYHLPGKRGC